jgi:hypothetical protein
MTYPSFSAGEVLRAADMNAVGLWRVGGGALSTATTDFVGCFTGDYTDYRIVIDQITWSGTGDLYFRMLDGTTPETSALYSWAYNGISAVNVAANSVGNGQDLGYLGTSNNGLNNSVVGSASFDIYAPNIAVRTLLTGSGIGVVTDFVSKVGIAAHNVGTAYNGIRLLTGSAVTMTGNVSIYGYRKA